MEWVQEVLVVDNGSTDRTVAVARAGGAIVVDQPRRGYGRACLTGMEWARSHPPDIVVFLDGDYSDHPDEVPVLLAPIVRGEADLVIGSRVRGERSRGALLPQAIIGNWIATRFIQIQLRRLRSISIAILKAIGVTRQPLRSPSRVQKPPPWTTSSAFIPLFTVLTAAKS